MKIIQPSKDFIQNYSNQDVSCSVSIYWASCGPSACAHMQGGDMCFLYWVSLYKHIWGSFTCLIESLYRYNITWCQKWEMSFTVKAPDKFSYKAEEWPQWIRRFERYRLASDLAEKESPVQVNTLIYCLGEKSEDILASFRLSAEDSGKYDVVKKKFDDYFVIRKNIIFERAKFNRRAQAGRGRNSRWICDCIK